jgi:hypothetical protein
MNQPNRVIIALASIAAGGAAGAALAAAAAWGANAMALRGINLIGDPRNIVFLGTGLGLLLAVVLAWSLSAAVGEAWRRAAVATLAGFAAVLLGMAAVPVNMLSLMVSSQLMSVLLPPGYVVVLILAAVLAIWIVRRSQAPPGSPPPA